MNTERKTNPEDVDFGHADLMNEHKDHCPTPCPGFDAEGRQEQTNVAGHNDRMWIQYAGHPGRWIERIQAEKNNLADEFETTCKRLYARGHFVVLVAGDSCCLEEVFLFEAGQDAAIEVKQYEF
jgi:hypothetical protein